MSDTAMPSAKLPLGVGSILGESFSLYFRNFLPMTLVALIPVVVGIFINFVVIGVDQQAALATDPGALPTGLFVQLAISGVIGLILWGFSVAAITRLAYDAKVGNPVSIGAGIQSAFSNLVPVIICMLLGGIGIYMGLLLVLIPGLILAAMWFLIVPAIVVEKAGFGAFKRSAQLTKEYRWPLIGLLALFFLVVIVVSIVFGLISGAVALSGAGGDGFLTTFLIVQTIVNGAVSVFVYGVSGAMVALVYARLLEIKEGTTLQSLVDVFS